MLNKITIANKTLVSSNTIFIISLDDITLHFNSYNVIFQFQRTVDVNDSEVLKTKIIDNNLYLILNNIDSYNHIIQSEPLNIGTLLSKQLYIQFIVEHKTKKIYSLTYNILTDSI